MRSVLEEDLAYRAGELTRNGVAAMPADMHPELSIYDDILRIAKKRVDLHQDEHLVGHGVVLVPSVFVWPNVVFAVDPAQPPRLTYPARGVGNLWGREEPDLADSDPLPALLGRSRAEILTALHLPCCTTDLRTDLAASIVDTRAAHYPADPGQAFRGREDRIRRRTSQPVAPSSSVYSTYGCRLAAAVNNRRRYRGPLPMALAGRSAVDPVACLERPAQPDRAAAALRGDGFPRVIVPVAARPQLGVRQGDACEAGMARPVLS
jgi:hypothetical protein